MLLGDSRYEYAKNYIISFSFRMYQIFYFFILKLNYGKTKIENTRHSQKDVKR